MRHWQSRDRQTAQSVTAGDRNNACMRSYNCQSGDQAAAIKPLP
jgi:hypothetical protein